MGLSGNGVLLACIDSGVDYAHPDFCAPDGTSRIAILWDQTIPGNPPMGYVLGSVYTRQQINEALASSTPEERFALVPSRDVTGMGQRCSESQREMGDPRQMRPCRAWHRKQHSWS